MASLLSPKEDVYPTTGKSINSMQSSVPPALTPHSNLASQFSAPTRGICKMYGQINQSPTLASPYQASLTS